MDRRTLLTRGTVLVGVALAGCTSDEDPAPPTDGDGSDGSDGGDGSGGSGDDGDATTVEEMTETATSTDGTTEPTSEETAGTATDGTTESTTDGTTGTTTDDGTGSPPSSVEVSVGADGARFDPETFEVRVGGTVTWVWEGSGHNVRPSGRPDGANWSGTDGGDGTTYNGGHTHEYTFDVAGEYEYYCAPHRTFGMTGSFTVVE